MSKNIFIGPIQSRLQNFPPLPSLEAAVADAIAEERQRPQRGVAAQTSPKGLRRRPKAERQAPLASTFITGFWAM